MKKPNIVIVNVKLNCQIVGTEEGQFLYSYGTLIASKQGGKTYLNKSKWDYSNTTGKHRNEFLGEGISETRKKINSGEYQFFE